MAVFGVCFARTWVYNPYGLGGTIMSTRTFTAAIHKEGEVYVALCPELDIASQGETIETARENLREAVELFLETASPKEVAERLHGEIYVTPLEVNIG
jgi:predicted RNase H-like HicB family nuclease